MTIEKYLQDKVDINEILASDRDFILKAIDKIENKKNFREEHKYYIYRILSIFYIDYLNEVRVKRVKEDIFNNIRDGITKDKISELEIVLDILFFENVLRKDSSVFTCFYYLNDAVLNDNENIKDSNCEYECNNGYDCKNCQSEEEIKKTAIIRAENIFTTYNNYHNEAIKQIETTLKSVFGFEIESADGKLDFQMGDCIYNVYLSRGFIWLEEEDNSSVENVWNAESVEEFIDLIKDLQEDN